MPTRPFWRSLLTAPSAKTSSSRTSSTTIQGPGAVDFMCGPLVYDTHGGTDIRLLSIEQMEAGVPVLAATSDEVVGIRDSMDDVRVSTIGRDSLDGRDAGNGVRINHGDGWATQYAHIMKGSVRVNVGERVETGQALGFVGMSGNADFPHLHLSVSYEDQKLDPYVGVTDDYACGESVSPVWSTQSLNRLPYLSGGGLQAGFAAGKSKTETTRNSY
tara:strand:+ start:257 stop:904 length:648 start_codon:yes stop_codon:yes gene_type:complete